MKKQLLLGAFLLSSILGANAQYATSFESSEGFTLGSLNSQNGWGVSAAAVSGTNVSDADSSDGDYSLSLMGNGAGTTSLIGAFSSNDISVSGDLDFSFDIKIPTLSANGTEFYISSQAPTQQMLTARMVFANTGEILILDVDPQGTPQAPLNFFLAEGTIEADTWYNVRIAHNFSQDNIEFYLDDTLIYTTAEVFAATAVEQLVFVHDNGATGAFIDNIAVTGQTASVKNPIASQFSIYPNPATDVINIANADNILVNNVAVVDLNGRTVKSLNFDGVTEAQVNIADLAAGMYLLNVSSDKGTMTKKIVKN